MDSNNELWELHNRGVDNIDDEVYYREILGCSAKAEGATCATVNCGQGDVKLCETPEGTAKRMAAAMEPVGPGC